MKPLRTSFNLLVGWGGNVWSELCGFLPQRRTDSRGGRFRMAVASGIFARGTTALAGLVTFPIMVRYLGNEGFGLMSLLTSVVGWLQFTNMGLGLGLQNVLTEAVAKDDRVAQKKLISTTAVMLGGIAVLLLLVIAVGARFVEWRRLFPVSSEEYAAVLPLAAGAVVICFLVNFALGFVGPIYAARQELHISNLQVVVTAIVGLVAVLVAARLQAGLLGMVLAVVGVGACVQTAFAVWTCFGRGKWELRLSPRFVYGGALRRVWSTGVVFLALQLCNIIYFQADAFLISHLVSTASYTPYVVAQKIFMLVGSLSAVAYGAIWAAFGNAMALGDVAWMRQAYRRVVTAMILMYVGLLLVMMAVGQKLLGLWVGAEAVPTWTLLMTTALFFFVRDWCGLHATLLNGLNVVKAQIAPAILNAVLYLGFAVVLLKRVGVTGMPLAGLLATTTTLAWFLPMLLHKTLQQMDAPAVPPRDSLRP